MLLFCSLLRIRYSTVFGLSCSLIVFLASCSSSQGIVMVSTQVVQPTILALPSPSEVVLNHMDPIVQAYIEQGSPASFRNAVERIYATSQGLTTDKQFQLTLLSRLMRLLYPLEIVDWSVPSYQHDNIYLTALAKIEEGQYPQSLGTESFLDAIIPAIILTKGIGVHEYGRMLEKRLFTARSLNPTSVLPFYLLGTLYELSGKLADAEDYYQIAWEQDNSCYPVGMRYAALSLLRDNIETACEIAEQLYTRYPDSTAIQLLLAESYIDKGELEQAAVLVDKLIKQSGDQNNVMFLRVRLHIKKKEYLIASSLLNEIAKKNKVEKDYLLLRSSVLWEWSKNTVEAKQCLEKAESLYPLAGDVILACANFCFETKNTVNGKNTNAFIDALLKQNPRNILAIRLLIKQDIADQYWENAFERAQYLYSGNPSEEDIILYARVCAGMNNWTEAVNVAKAAYTASQSPSDEITTLYLQALYGAKKYDRLNSIISIRLPAARSSLKSVLIYYQALLESNDEERLTLLRSSLLSDPRSSLTLFALYEWYFRHKDYRKAAYYLQQVLAFDPENKRYLALADQLEKLQTKF